jgi:3-methyl-2-oxobutanoate hydroxymethyltransferase
MGNSAPRKFGLSDLKQARVTGRKLAMLTCYDYTTARLMHEVGVPLILVGDSAANVILGYPTTLPVSLEFMIEITRAVRRGAPDALLIADMPFGSVHGSVARSVRNVVRVVQQTGCDMVKIETTPRSARLITELTDAGVAVIAHLGLKPQSIHVLGSYRYQARTASEARQLIDEALSMERAGAAAILLEAVPPEVSELLVRKSRVPVIGCGAGPACHASVVVTHDLLGLTPSAPRFAPVLSDLATKMKAAFLEYMNQLQNGAYPASEHCYTMPPAEREALLKSVDELEVIERS